jgi:hypothetical protein
MSSKVLTCSQVVTCLRENLLMKFAIQNERDEEEERKT